jgi:hypothetical protein
LDLFNIENNFYLIKKELHLPDVLKFPFISSRTTGFACDAFGNAIKLLPLVVSKLRIEPGKRT